MSQDTTPSKNEFPLSDFELMLDGKWIPLEEFAEQCGLQAEKLKATPVKSVDQDDKGDLCVASAFPDYEIGEMYLSSWRKKSQFENILKGVSPGGMIAYF